MIQETIKIVLIEDNINDAKLIIRQIEKIALNPLVKHVTAFDQFVAAIADFKPDIVLCDYQLNGFTGFDILAYIAILPQYIPVIFITGTINDEELAASTILNGASGYLLKNNINMLHKKMLPYFNKIIDAKQVVPLTKEHKAVLLEMETYLEDVARENKAIKANYLEMKRTLDKMKGRSK